MRSRRLVGILSTATFLGWALAATVYAAQTTPGPEANTTPQTSPPPTISAEDLELLNRILFWVDAEPDSGEAPLKVKFKPDLEGEEVKKPRFHWDFGDGTNSKEREPVHVFKRPGEYKVSCRIDDVDGRWGRDEVTIYVEPKENPPAPPTPEKKAKAKKEQKKQ